MQFTYVQILDDDNTWDYNSSLSSGFEPIFHRVEPNALESEPIGENFGPILV